MGGENLKRWFVRSRENSVLTHVYVSKRGGILSIHHGTMGDMRRC